MPIFPFLIPIFFMICAAAIVKWSLEYNKWKIQYKSGRSTSDNSLAMGELKAMIQEVVEANIDPLRERIEGVESRLDDLDADHLLEARRAPRLEGPLDALEQEAARSRRQRVS